MNRTLLRETRPSRYGRVTKSWLQLIGMLPGVILAALALAATPDLYNAYERPKNGPPLTNVWHKAKPAWLWTKLHDPKHQSAARMPDFKLADDEVLDIMSFLKAVADSSFPSVQWSAWASKDEDDMSDDEWDAMSALVDKGDVLWRKARCTICHTVEGPADSSIGGFVDLRVGGINLENAASKLKRDWVYQWIKEPMSYFPDTLMPRYRFTHEEIKSLTEFILRDEIFLPDEDEEQEESTASPPPQWHLLDDPVRAERGEKLVEIGRCVVCHDIKGIAEVIAKPERELPPRGENFEFLVYEIRCLSCHTVAGRGGTYAPNLTTVGSRLHADWITQFVATPDMLRPLSQQMPKFNLTKQEAEIIASEVSRSLRDKLIGGDIPGATVAPEDIQKGAEMFSERGCVACHTTGEGSGGLVGPSLDAVGDRLKSGYIWYHLKNPQGVNAYSAEPDYGLSDDEARLLAAFLSRRKE